MEKIILTGDRPTGRLHIGHYVGSLRREIALRRSSVSCGSLRYWINIYHFGKGAEKFRTLKTGVRRNYAKERAKHFCIPTTAASKAFIELLHLESSTKTVYRKDT